jgi:hypothetical protein
MLSFPTKWNQRTALARVMVLVKSDIKVGCDTCVNIYSYSSRVLGIKNRISSVGHERMYSIGV